MLVEQVERIVLSTQKDICEKRMQSKMELIFVWILEMKGLKDRHLELNI